MLENARGRINPIHFPAQKYTLRFTAKKISFDYPCVSLTLRGIETIEIFLKIYWLFQYTFEYGVVKNSETLPNTLSL